jgi:hypothetical protein
MELIAALFIVGCGFATCFFLGAMWGVRGAARQLNKALQSKEGE